MGSNTTRLDDETMAYSLDSSSEAATSSEAAVTSLRELRDALEEASDLASEETSTVDAFIETLRSLPIPISQISVDPSLLSGLLGPVEDARINAEGVLILASPDGTIENVDLTSFDNRDLLVSILGDLVEKLREVANGNQIPPEIPADKPDVEVGIIDTPIIDEPLEIEEIAEPESPEEIILPIDEIEEPDEEQFFVGSEPVEPAIEELSKPPPEPIEYEPPTVPPEEAPIFVPNVQSNSILRRFRGEVLQQKGEASRRISEIRRLREGQVQKMRVGIKEPWALENPGVLASLKKLLSRRTGKR